MRKSREEKKSGSKEHEQTRISTDGEETATETEIAIEIETNVVGEWMMRRAVTTRAVIGKNFFFQLALKIYIFDKFFVITFC